MNKKVIIIISIMTIMLMSLGTYFLIKNKEEEKIKKAKVVIRT